MSTSVAGTEVRRYLEAIRTHLQDLPPDERDELLEDLEEHLLEVAAEEDGTLEQRLGPPATYAEELRISTGLSARGEEGLGLAERIVHSQPVRAAAVALDSPQARALRRFVREVQPGWWVLRGYLAVVVPAIITSGNNVRNNIPFPYLGGSPVVGAALALVAIWLSVVLGRRGRTFRGAKLLTIAGSLAVILASISTFASWHSGAYAYEGVDDGSGYEVDYLHHADGTAIANICPYSSDGTLLTGVLLFDQEGRAIINAASAQTFGGQPVIRNAYPRPLAFVDGTGQLRPLSCPPSITAQPSPIPSPGSTGP